MLRRCRNKENIWLSFEFFVGLKSEYEPVKPQILGGAELPTFAETYSRILRAFSRDSYQNGDFWM